MKKETLLTILTAFLLGGGFLGHCVLLLICCEPGLSGEEGFLTNGLRFYSLYGQNMLFWGMLIAGGILWLVQWRRACRREDKEPGQEE